MFAKMNISSFSIYMSKFTNFINPKIYPADFWFWPIFGFASIFSVLSLHIKQGKFHLKGNIHVYIFHEGNYLKFSHLRVQILVEKLRDNLSSFDF
jgi:hypothetical protein